MANRLSVVFRRLVRLGNFPPCWRQDNGTPIPKGPPSSSVTNYRPISITSVLSKVFEPLVSVRFGQFMERNGELPNTQFAYRKGLGNCDSLLCVSQHYKVQWRVGKRSRSCRLISVQPLMHLQDGSWWLNPTTPDDGHSNHPQTGKRHEYPQPARQPLMLVNNQKFGHLGQCCCKDRTHKDSVSHHTP